MAVLKAIVLTWRIMIASALLFAMLSASGLVTPVILAWIVVYVAADTVVTMRQATEEMQALRS